MLFELAFRNIKRSKKDYLIYFITVTLAFSFIFSFHLIAFSKDILELSSMMENMQPAITFVSLIILFVVGWLIHYTMKFMLEKRSKEFGTYLLLGIEKKKVIQMFLIENLVLGLCSLAISFLVGFGISQLMTIVIMNIFELPYQVNISFGFLPFLLTFAYFFLIYAFVLFRSFRKIKKMKLYQLFYLEKQNEKKIYRTKKGRIFVFLIALLTGIGACFLFRYAMILAIQNSSTSPMLFILISLLLLIVSIYGVALTAADAFTSFLLKHPNLKYRGDHLFITRQFTSKIRSMGMTMGTLSLLITFTLLALNVSNLFSAMFQTQTENSAPYDIMIYNLYSETDSEIGTSEVPLEKYLNFVEDHYTIEEKLTYQVYTNQTDQIRKHISNGVTGYQPFDCFLKLSDYNRLLKMRGMKEISLEEDEFYIHSFRDVSKELETYLNDHEELNIGNTILTLKALTDQNYTTSWSRGSSYVVVVPDAVITDQFSIVNQITAINTKEETTEAFADEFDQICPPKVWVTDEGTYETLISIQQTTVKGAVLNENRSMMTILSFSFLYLALIFIAVVGTILSIQSLSDSKKYRYRFSVLKKLGMDDEAIHHTLWKQVLLFFALPILYPILISFLSSTSLALIFDTFMEHDQSILFSILTNLGLFFFIYGIYFFATYFGFKKNNQEN